MSEENPNIGLPNGGQAESAAPPTIDVETPPAPKKMRAKSMLKAVEDAKEAAKPVPFIIGGNGSQPPKVETAPELVEDEQSEPPNDVVKDFDFDDLVEDDDYVFDADAESILSIVRVGKPGRLTFFRTHPDKAYRKVAWLVCDKDTGVKPEYYIVAKNMVDALEGIAYRATLYTCITRGGVTFLYPIRHPNEDGNRDEWTKTADIGVHKAKTEWVRVTANMSKKHNDVVPSKGQWGEPEFRKETFTEILRVAFDKDHIINDGSSKYFDKLRGI